MYYSELIANFDGIFIGFIIHEQPITYGSNWGKYNGFYLTLNKRNKRVRPKTRILKTTGGYYIDNIDRHFYKKCIKFITYNQKFTPEEEKIVKDGVKYGKICIGKQR